MVVCLCINEQYTNFYPNLPIHCTCRIRYAMLTNVSWLIDPTTDDCKQFYIYNNQRHGMVMVSYMI